MTQKRIAIFGSTGSIGKQALEVIEANTDKFSVEVLTAHTNDELLVQQALKFNPNIVVIGDDKKYNKVKDALSKKGIKVFAGEFVNRHNLHTASNAQRAVEALLTKDAIDRDNGSFLITDRFFRLWIQSAQSV